MSLRKARLDVLRASLTPSGSSPRPIMTSLNGDNSWLISFPRPEADRKASGKCFYHVVADVWLIGPSIEGFASWILQFEHPEEAAIQSGKAVSDIVADIEEMAASAGLVPMPKDKSTIDAMLITNEAMDHLHKPSLATFDKDIPVFAIKPAAAALRAWGHFSDVYEYQDMDPSTTDWRALHPGAPLPPWLSVFRLHGGHVLQWATTIVYSPEADKHDAIMWAPHSVPVKQPALQALLTKMEPPIRIPCVMQGLNGTILLGVIPFTQGIDAGLALAREVKPKYWIKTHHQLRYKGGMGRVLRDYPGDLESALQKVAKESGLPVKTAELPKVVDVGNGRSFVLEEWVS